MKTKFHKSLTLVVSILLCWMVPTESWSAVEWDGIYYDLDTSAKTATVTSNPDKYSGHVFLPESINYEGITYTVTRIGTCAFLDCSSMTGITIPSGVTVIEPSAFERCSGLTALTVGKGVTTIDYEAFKNCISLATLILPTSLNTIGNESFGGCSSLRTIVVERTTAPKIVSTTFNGVDKASCTLYVPEGRRSAYANAAYWKLFTNIVDNRTDVLATGQCGDNVTYTIYSDMKMVISGEGEMWYNDGYENPICGDYSKSIQQLIIEEGVTTISDYAFFGYDRLTSVDIPRTITVLGNSAFRGCSSLERINIHDLTTWCGIEFGNANMDYYPDAPFDNMPLYMNGELIEELVIPEGVTEISAGAFYNCRSLTSVYIFADLPGIQRYTFDGCDNVTFLYIGDGLGFFGWFSINMPHLRTFVLNTPEPPAIDYMSIFIGGATIYVPSGSLAAYKSASGWKDFGIVDKPIVLETGACGDNVSYTLYSDMKMVISGTGEMWDIYDSENPICDKYAQSVQQVIIEDGVTTISGYAFFGYNRVTSVDIPPSITVLGNSAFRGCSSLERINIHDLTAWCGIEFGNTNMDYYPDAPFDNMPLYLNGKLLEELVLTEEVTDISAGAFYNCRSLTSVYIHSDLRGIRPYTFDGCDNVTSLYLGYSVGSFGWFSINMPNLRTFVLDVLEPPTLLYHMSIRIGNATIYVPSSSLATYQNDSGIYGDESWKEYSNCLKAFMFSTNFIFYGLEPENLTAKVIDTEYTNTTVPFDVTIPETIDCNGATYTVTGIGHRAFELFNEMSEIILPSTITSVEDLAFNKLRGMTDVYCRAVEPPTASASAFENMNVSEVVLHVPAGSKETYQSSDGWKDFANIVEDVSDNAIYVERVEGRIGGTMDIPVKLRNRYAVRGFQFVMELPEGTTINSWALSTDRLPSGATQSDVLATQKIEGNKIIVACSLNYGDATFTGNDGEIATINVTFCEEMEAGTYPIYLTECDVTNAVGTDEALSDVTGTLILEDYVIGDANSDGKVRVGDAIAILSYIIGNTPENFNEKAADVNGDGLLRIGDVTAVLNIIVNQ